MRAAILQNYIRSRSSRTAVCTSTWCVLPQTLGDGALRSDTTSLHHWAHDSPTPQLFSSLLIIYFQPGKSHSNWFTATFGSFPFFVHFSSRPLSPFLFLFQSITKNVEGSAVKVCFFKEKNWTVKVSFRVSSKKKKTTPFLKMEKKWIRNSNETDHDGQKTQDLSSGSSKKGENNRFLSKDFWRVPPRPDSLTDFFTCLLRLSQVEKGLISATELLTGQYSGWVALGVWRNSRDTCVFIYQTLHSWEGLFLCQANVLAHLKYCSKRNLCPVWRPLRSLNWDKINCPARVWSWRCANSVQPIIAQILFSLFSFFFWAKTFLILAHDGASFLPKTREKKHS